MKINSATVTPRYPWSCNDAVAQDIIRPVHPPPWRIWVTLLFDYQRSSLRIIRHALRHSSSHPRCGVLLIRLARDNSSSSIVSEFYSRYFQALRPDEWIHKDSSKPTHHYANLDRSWKVPPGRGLIFSWHLSPGTCHLKWWR